MTRIRRRSLLTYTGSSLKTTALYVKFRTMTNSIRKGKAGEREIVNILKEAGVPAKRIGGMETDHISKGDVEIELAGVWKAQVKLGSHVPVTIYKFLEHEDLVFMRRDRREWLVCMKFDFFKEKFL